MWVRRDRDARDLVESLKLPLDTQTPYHQWWKQLVS
jgi:hypothetical protein